MLQFVLHASPDTAKVYSVHPIEVLRGLVRCIARRHLDARVVERHIEPAEMRHSPLDHVCDLRLVGDIADHTHDPTPGGRQPVGGYLQRLFVDVGENDGRPGDGESFRRRQSHARTRSGHQSDLAAEIIGRIHQNHLTSIWLQA